jgi:hypothetical protein
MLAVAVSKSMRSIVVLLVSVVIITNILYLANIQKRIEIKARKQRVFA